MTIFLIVLSAYVGLCVWLVYGRGPFRLAYNPLIAWYLRKLNVVAQCIGARGYLARPEYTFSFAQRDELYKHEGWHYQHQWRVWGPLFLPIYWTLLAIYGYDKHPWEQASRRAAGEPER